MIKRIRLMDFSDYKKFLIQNYPSVIPFLDKEKWMPPFFSEVISLSSEAFHSIELVVKTLFSLKQDPEYLESVFKETPRFISHASSRDSVLMAYDFHIDEAALPRLIEVNTNASGFLLVNSLYQFHKINHQKSLESLKQSFQQEWNVFNSGTTQPPQKLVLIDEKPLEQKMFVEFLMYKDFFKSIGWSLEICDSSSLKIDEEGHLLNSKKEKIDFIYNRSTDFGFDKSPHLLKAYETNSCCVSPHPREYFLLSDKRRLCSWFLEKEKWPQLKAIEKYLIPSYSFTKDQEKEKEEVWKNKKKYFFKSIGSHGGKMAYRGSNLTHKKFELLSENSFIYQEYIPPSVFRDLKGEKWKLDFRAFVYRDQIQQLAARCYKGQITNFKEPRSGWALVQVD